MHAVKQKCDECPQKDSCKDVYRQLGEYNGPSIAFKVLVVFVIPVLIFIFTLAVVDKLLLRSINSRDMVSLVSFLIALIVTLLVVFIISFVIKKYSKRIDEIKKHERFE
ncbi:MAG: hypothetical protein ISS77_06085 [Phycisphaerae bacterium]|nr:hypothetical protein [Phycisphaerae bacterium]